MVIPCVTLTSVKGGVIFEKLERTPERKWRKKFEHDRKEADENNLSRFRSGNILLKGVRRRKTGKYSEKGEGRKFSGKVFRARVLLKIRKTTEEQVNWCVSLEAELHEIPWGPRLLQFGAGKAVRCSAQTAPSIERRA